MFELWQKFRRCLGLPTEEMSAHFCPSLAAVKVGWLYFSTLLLAFHAFFSRFFFAALRFYFKYRQWAWQQVNYAPL